jgi:hypothetical protein
MIQMIFVDRNSNDLRGSDWMWPPIPCVLGGRAAAADVEHGVIRVMPLRMPLLHVGPIV